ncbi:hypothetical protein EYF80_032201 [Liparis tanakae]|uniref:Uncharacterized protein n=1 Tax=Liparis tanakae TaxID=230148 RepID=A0A4Z2GVW8_9TELE|nr:hypothetical protein EYF80_032201 [Liparis tanakae]
MEVKLREAWFTNWHLKIAPQLREQRPGTRVKPERQCVGNRSQRKTSSQHRNKVSIGTTLSSTASCLEFTTSAAAAAMCLCTS